MIVVQKANKQININDDELDLYLSQGFSQIDEEGKIVQAGKATSLSEIREENATLKVELVKLKAEIEKLKKENAKLKKAE